MSLQSPLEPPTFEQPKVFLTALAILDDLGAVLIIAVFYTGELNLYALGGAAFVLVLLSGLNRAGFSDLKPYLLLGAVLWFLVFMSGIHATLAGVALRSRSRYGPLPASRRTWPRHCTNSNTPSSPGWRS